jgi:hypothetical protein
MSKLFNQVQMFAPRKNSFDLSHERKLTCNMGELIPILNEEVVPGDEFKSNSEIFLRLMPMVFPIMHRVNVFTHFFFVPYRLIWDEWEKFITGGDHGDDTATVPWMELSVSQSVMAGEKLLDHLGYVINDVLNPTVEVNNILAVRAYNLIYNEYYRDQSLQSRVDISKASGKDTTTPVDVLLRCWEKDYFTSAQPTPQRGGEVTLPLNGNADVYLNDNSTLPMKFVNASTGNDIVSNTMGVDANGQIQSNTNPELGVIDPAGRLYADLTTATSSTIEELRRATKLQMWLEKNARAGSRYVEQILSHFGVRVPDYRLQRPEYIGGGKSPIIISEVLQQSETGEGSPLGNMAGHGISVGNTHEFNKRFDEHGIVIGILSVLPRSAYMNGARRSFFKQDRFDYYFPEFAQLGEQPVLNGEIYNDQALPNSTFGYQSRYAEYKFIPSTIHGEMRRTLSKWHMARQFASCPPLNGEFVRTDDITDDIFAYTSSDYDHIIIQIFTNLRALRPMPFFNVPSL